MNVLIIAAHPDDDILGMGGTMLKHSSNGDNVTVMYLATGIAARRQSGYQNSTRYNFNKKEYEKIKSEIGIIRIQAQKACKILGVKNALFYEFPDNEMDSVPLLRVVKTIESVIKKYKPYRIYTNHYGDLNVDHRIVYNAALTACRPVHFKIKELVCFEVPSSTEWNYPGIFRPNYFVNIAKELPKKILAMKMYKSEIREFPHPRSEQNLKILAGHWGSVCGQKAAEAFEIIRMIKN
ncbi:MAG: PIG-L family deacetylase [Nitrososphaerota archaeon]